METIDPQKAQRVWQRVHAAAPVPSPMPPQSLPAVLQPEQLSMLIRQEWAEAARYTRLSRKPGQYRSLFQQMARQERSHLFTLKGIYTLLTGRHPQVIHPSPEPTNDSLRACYRAELQGLNRYEALAEHPEYGRIFRLLAQQEQEHCRILLMILGSK